MKRLFLYSTLMLSAFSSIVQAKETKDYPEVISVFSEVSFDGHTQGAGKCTGTFITPRLLLTASHCVRHFNASRMNGRVFRATDMSGHPAADLTATPEQVYILNPKWWGTKKIHPTHVYVSESAMPVEHADLSLDYVEQDLAILEFANPAPNTREIADRSPGIGEAMLMIGFGHHGPRGAEGAGFGGSLPTKHFGRNFLESSELDMLVTSGSAQTCVDPGPYTDNWSICPGDSGGPLIDADTGKIVGVASASNTQGISPSTPEGTRKLSIYTDLTSTAAVQFVRSVIQASGG